MPIWQLCGVTCLRHADDLTEVINADFGVEHSVPLTGMDASGVDKALEDLVKKGESMPR